MYYDQRLKKNIEKKNNKGSSCLLTH